MPWYDATVYLHRGHVHLKTLQEKQIWAELKDTGKRRLSVGGSGDKTTALSPNALPACLCLRWFTLPCSRSWYFILVSDGLLGRSFILTRWAMRPRVWYLPLAKRVKMAIILLSTHTAQRKWYYSLRFTAVQGNTKGVLLLWGFQSSWNAAES